jgi:hypothetical protein
MLGDLEEPGNNVETHQASRVGSALLIIGYSCWQMICALLDGSMDALMLPQLPHKGRKNSVGLHS